MLAREIPGEFVVAARRDNEFNFILLIYRVQIRHVERVRLARIRALYIDDLYYFARKHADRSFAAGFDHHRIARSEELLGERGSLRLQ